MNEDLLSLADIADGISFEMISMRLPHKELQKLVGHALKLGRERKPLTEEAFLDAVSLQALVGFIPLEHVWKSVVLERVAGPNGFTGAAASTETGAAAVAPVATARKSVPPPPPAEVAHGRCTRKSVPPPRSPP